MLLALLGWQNLTTLPTLSARPPPLRSGRILARLRAASAHRPGCGLNVVSADAGRPLGDERPAARRIAVRESPQECCAPAAAGAAPPDRSWLACGRDRGPAPLEPGTPGRPRGRWHVRPTPETRDPPARIGRTGTSARRTGSAPDATPRCWRHEKRETLTSTPADGAAVGPVPHARARPVPSGKRQLAASS
jgi:hypothetical protein